MTNDIDITADEIGDYTVDELSELIADTPEGAERELLKAKLRTAEQASGQPRQGVIDATEAAAPPADDPRTGDVAGAELPRGVEVDDNGRQIAQPDLIDDGDLPPVAEVGAKQAADEDAALAATQDSGRLSLADTDA